MKYIYPDYSNSLINLMNSIRLFFNLNKTHDSLEDVDKILKENSEKHIIVMLLDGMGSKILDKHLDENSFLQSHKYRDFLSSFPSTTVAATTTVRSTLNPIETGWLGWTSYVKEYDDVIDTFLDKSHYENKIYEKGTMENYLPFYNFVDELSDNGYKAVEIFPSFKKDKIHANTFNEFLRKTKRLSKSNNYVYAYWDNPDSMLHQLGTDSKKITRLLKYYDYKIKNFYKKLDKNTICFIIADHGHINNQIIDLSSYPKFLRLLKHNPSIEGRNMTFFIKDGKDSEFIDFYNKNLSQDFLLFSKDEILDKKLFGDGKVNKKANDFIGDYQIVSISNKSLEILNGKNSDLVSTHAGMSEDEMIIPLIILNK